MAGWLGDQKIFSITGEGVQNETWLSSDVYISSITHSGDTVTVSGTVHLYARCNWSATGPICYYGDPINVTPKGGSAVELKGVTSATTYEWDKDQDVSSVNFTTSFAAPAGSTSAEFTIYYKDTRRDDWVNTTKTWTITFEPSYTPPAQPSVSVSNIKYNKMDVTYGTSSFGNPSSGSVVLKFNGTQKASKTTTGNSTVTVTGLTKGTAYNIQVVADNSHLTASNSTSATTRTSAYEKNYCSVNGKTKQTKKVLFSLNGKTKYATKVYMSVNGKTKLAFDKDV